MRIYVPIEPTSWRRRSPAAGLPAGAGAGPGDAGPATAPTTCSRTRPTGTARTELLCCHLTALRTH